jgi:hypothetical protein
MAIEGYILTVLLLGLESPILGCIDGGAGKHRMPLYHLDTRNFAFSVYQNVYEYLPIDLGLA